MSNAAVQMDLYQAILAVIEQKRANSGDPSLGANIERLILDTQFEELEHEILENPGAFEPWLIRRRQYFSVASPPLFRWRECGLRTPQVTEHGQPVASGLVHDLQGRVRRWGAILIAIGSLALAAAIAEVALKALMTAMTSSRERIPT